ncbi:MAG: neutral/alkaline non-lysosomal ceramidase N-terminal domain-containing protein [Candidatus Sumerlaeia bacterium]|nr:neutral/alkaline non-lysosomal ceramidase N-terminal domain-containing protein [Candidatus Sumerlaeia bacterium]
MVWRIQLTAIAALAYLMLAAPSHSAQLRAGVGKAEITPEGRVPMAGYAARTAPSSGVLTPLFAKALVLECGGKKIALVAMDIIRFPSERVPQEAEKRFGIGLTLMAASHTHAGPEFRPTAWKDQATREKLLRWTEDRVIEAIERAAQNMFPARLSIAHGEITLGYNRMVVGPNGRRRLMSLNPERIPYGPVDPTVAVIRVENADAGTTRALVVGYACHPVNHGSNNLLISAEYPGAMADKIESTLAGPPMCLFVQGAGGSVNPLFRENPKAEPGAIKEGRKMGNFLAEEVLRALRTAQPVKGPDEIQWRKHTLTFRHRWSTTATVPIEMATVLINRTIGVAAVPGESFLRLQTAFKRDANVPFPFYAGYTTCGGVEWPMYLPDIRSAAEGGYGAADGTTRIEVGAPEQIVNRAVIDLYDMKNMFFEKPEK